MFEIQPLLYRVIGSDSVSVIQNYKHIDAYKGLWKTRVIYECL